MKSVYLNKHYNLKAHTTAYVWLKAALILAIDMCFNTGHICAGWILITVNYLLYEVTLSKTKDFIALDLTTNAHICA
jgi:hypothetical protein